MTTISVHGMLVEDGDGRVVSTYRAIENVFVALLADLQSDVGGITRGNIRLGHEESRTNLALQQRLEPFVLLCLCSVLGNDLHVSSVRGGAVGGLGGGATLAQVLGHQSVLQVAEASSLLEVVSWEEHVP